VVTTRDLDAHGVDLQELERLVLPT
jgi:hypothetical protein